MFCELHMDIQWLYFSDNTIHCDCHLSWITAQADIFALNGACHTPASLQGMYLFTLQSSNLTCYDESIPLDSRCELSSTAEDFALKPALISSSKITLVWEVANDADPLSFTVGYFVKNDVTSSQVLPDSSNYNDFKRDTTNDVTPDDLTEEFKVEATLDKRAREYTLQKLTGGRDYKACVVMQLEAASNQEACVTVQTAPPTYPPPTQSTGPTTKAHKKYAGWVVAIAVLASVFVTAIALSLLFVGYIKRNFGQQQAEEDDDSNYYENEVRNTSL